MVALFVKDKRLRTVWGYIPGVEINLLKQVNLKVYANMIGRIYRYSDYAQSKFGMVNSDNYRFSVGIVTPLLIL